MYKLQYEFKHLLFFQKLHLIQVVKFKQKIKILTTVVQV